jgi:hypothetical protein
VVGNGSCSWVCVCMYMSVYNTGKGSADYVTIVLTGAETCTNYSECCVDKGLEGSGVRNLKLHNFRLSRFKRLGNIHLVTFLERTPIFSPAGVIA